MRKQPFRGRCINEPEFSCDCSLEPYCRRTDPTLRPPLTEKSHGAVMSRFVFGTPYEKYRAYVTLDDWRMEKEVRAITNGQDLNLCTRTGRRP